MAGNTILKADSCHPHHVVNNIPYGEWVRLKRNCSEESTFEQESQLLYGRLKQRGYRDGVLENAYDKSKKLEGDSQKAKKQRDRDNKKVPGNIFQDLIIVLTVWGAGVAMECPGPMQLPYASGRSPDFISSAFKISAGPAGPSNHRLPKCPVWPVFGKAVRSCTKCSSCEQEEDKISGDWTEARGPGVDDAKKRKKSNGTENEATDIISREFSVPVPFSKKSIGIFSRCSEREYSWLMDLLNSQDFRDQVQSVRPYYISNRFSELCENVKQCRFGILYHSKKRGRINVTNVTDSLYDEELEHLSCRLGQKNVVVVIDDLDDVSDTMKKRILSAQYSISEHAEELILIKCASPEEKRTAAKDALKNILQPKKMEIFKKS
ncbi:uncharacterized protein LOC130285388 [Hyla sarda]|uniref:uncharacterized protein LOC130285388 n=1 Tax=Hyla sarda TaxID=327740 RepID=UPI0024C24D43|nr:uncharacterized protein LOC130285388 [Hyla sarda]